jgi:tetratricopeptide (TPR) repeat protein
MRFLAFVLLIMLGGSIWETLGNTPAFNPRLLSDTVVGEGRIPATEAMYDLGSYDFERGFGYLMADALISEETERRDQTASVDIAWERAVRAQVALERAVRRDPGNAHAWASLAWALIRQGDEQGAYAALQVSWELAPYNPGLARTRLDLVSVFAEFGGQEMLLLKPSRPAVTRDAEVMERYDDTGFQMLLKNNEALKKFLSV